MSDELDLRTRIDAALGHVTQLFLRQCMHGAQSKSLSPEFAACGQFIGEDAEAIEQYGLHGIAAAIRVLGPCESQDCGAVIGRLVSYCEACFGIHPTHPKRTDLDERGGGDTQNVIKLGELLYALGYVRTAQAQRDRLVEHIRGRLDSSLLKQRGWGYFLDDTEPQLLPTAYAVRGLAKHAYQVASPQSFLLESLTGKSLGTTDLTTTIACVYCLTFSGSSNLRDSKLEIAFRSAWKSVEPLLESLLRNSCEDKCEGRPKR